MGGTQPWRVVESKSESAVRLGCLQLGVQKEYMDTKFAVKQCQEVMKTS